MKIINNHSAQFKVVLEQHNQNQNHPIESAKSNNPNPNGFKKQLSKQNQELKNSISASGFRKKRVQEMDLSNFVTFDKKESLLLRMATSSLDIVENTHSKPRKSLEFKIITKRIFFI